VGYPAETHRMWDGLPKNYTHIDAVYERGDKKIVFFIGEFVYGILQNVHVFRVLVFVHSFVSAGVRCVALLYLRTRPCLLSALTDFLQTIQMPF
jgi:hypothetical protein